MKVQDFLKLVAKPERENLAAITADELGLGLLLLAALAPIANPEDVHFFDAENITKEKARQIEVEARLGARGGSRLGHFYVYKLQRLPTDSAGPLLKAVEEAKSARFIFQAQATPRKIQTLLSRSTTVRIPFLTRKMVLGNMKALNHDAKTADQLNLYDGTLAGTIKALQTKDSITEIQRSLRQGMRGLSALYAPEILNGLAFDTATYNHLTEQERRYVQRARQGDKTRLNARQKLVLYLVSQRTDTKDPDAGM